MNIEIDSKHIALEEFKLLYPKEAQILGQDVKSFKVIKGQLIYISESGEELKINAKSELEYHKRYFFKNSMYKELLAKAIGLKKGRAKPKVLDCTGGTLKDSLLMYSFGVELVVTERNSIAAALVSNAIEQNELNIEFHHQSADSEVFPCDVAYFDPMYEHKNEKSSPKKEMRIFRGAIGEDKDAFNVATHLRENYKRVVIKRSIKAPALLENPSMSIKGKSTRYDVYINLD